MANKKFVVKLSGEERCRLSELISKGKAKAKTILKARVLLKADQSEAGEGWADEEICRALDTNVTMVARVREKLVTEGLDAVLLRKKRDTPPIEPIFDGKRQAQLIALACSKPPAGRARWTIRLLAEQVVERKIVESAHFNTVARALKKRHQTAPQGILGHPTESQRRVRSRHGGRAGGIYPPARSGPTARVLGRNIQATRGGNANTATRSARTTSPLRLRIRAQWHRQPVHAIRPTRKLATRQGHRATHDHRLRAGSPRA